MLLSFKFQPGTATANGFNLYCMFSSWFFPGLSCACLSWVWEHWLPAFSVGEKAARWDSNSALLIHLGNILVLYGFMAAHHSHGNNFAKYLFLIFRKNFWVAMMDMKIKRRLDDRKLYIEKHGRSKKAKYMKKCINMLLIWILA